MLNQELKPIPYHEYKNADEPRKELILNAYEYFAAATKTLGTPITVENSTAQLTTNLAFIVPMRELDFQRYPIQNVVNVLKSPVVPQQLKRDGTLALLEQASIANNVPDTLPLIREIIRDPSFIKHPTFYDQLTNYLVRRGEDSFAREAIMYSTKSSNKPAALLRLSYLQAQVLHETQADETYTLALNMLDALDPTLQFNTIINCALVHAQFEQYDLAKQTLREAEKLLFTHRIGSLAENQTAFRLKDIGIAAAKISDLEYARELQGKIDLQPDSSERKVALKSNIDLAIHKYGKLSIAHIECVNVFGEDTEEVRDDYDTYFPTRFLQIYPQKSESAYPYLYYKTTAEQLAAAVQMHEELESTDQVVSHITSALLHVQAGFYEVAMSLLGSTQLESLNDAERVVRGFLYAADQVPGKQSESKVEQSPNFNFAYNELNAGLLEGLYRVPVAWEQSSSPWQNNSLYFRFDVGDEVPEHKRSRVNMWLDQDPEKREHLDQACIGKGYKKKKERRDLWILIPSNQAPISIHTTDNSVIYNGFDYGSKKPVTVYVNRRNGERRRIVHDK
ncbi:MAG TPA: hypothetical protein VGT05_03670 [Patescibacteria group bacterium]|nr:hypothetical protein [Patescibacteria group bacterium]